MEGREKGTTRGGEQAVASAGRTEEFKEWLVPRRRASRHETWCQVLRPLALTFLHVAANSTRGDPALQPRLRTGILRIKKRRNDGMLA